MDALIQRFNSKKSRWALGLMSLVGIGCLALLMFVGGNLDYGQYAYSVIHGFWSVLIFMMMVTTVLWLVSLLCGLCSRFGIARVRRVALVLFLVFFAIGLVLDAMTGEPAPINSKVPWWEPQKDTTWDYSTRMIPTWALAVPGYFAVGSWFFFTVYVLLAAISFYGWMVAETPADKEQLVDDAA